VAVNAGEVALYRQCRNEVRIDVPGLEDRPLILNGTEARTLTLAPSGQMQASASRRLGLTATSTSVPSRSR
ncbi:MAG: hypothetical protein AAGN64_15895, partial [Bacteroidota bacterium]